MPPPIAPVAAPITTAWIPTSAFVEQLAEACFGLGSWVPRATRHSLFNPERNYAGSMAGQLRVRSISLALSYELNARQHCLQHPPAYRNQQIFE